MANGESSGIRWIENPKWNSNTFQRAAANGVLLWSFGVMFVGLWVYSYLVGYRSWQATAGLFGLASLFFVVGALGFIPAAMRYPKSVGLSDAGVHFRTWVGVRQRAWPDILVAGEWKGKPPGMMALRTSRNMRQLGMGTGVSVVSKDQAAAIQGDPRYAPGRQEVPERFLVSMSKYDEPTLRSMVKNPDALERVLEYKRTHLVPEAQSAEPSPSTSR